MYTTKITSQGTISIPAALRKKYGFEIGQTVIIEDNGKIILSKPTDFASLRKENAKYIKKFIPYKSGDGWTAHVLEKYGK
jgi:AbrB family looped-hinge helix DNA binding protein